MAVQKRNKLNQLKRSLPEGLLVDAAWLENRGYSRSLRSHYVASDWLEQPCRGVFQRPRGKLRWEQVAISLQSLLDYPVAVGGRTALNMQGHAHYLRHSQPPTHLYGYSGLPGWLARLNLDQPFVCHNSHRLFPTLSFPQGKIPLDYLKSEDSGKTLNCGLRIVSWGQWHWPLVLSTPERAYLELLDELPGKETFDEVDKIMEGLVNLSPRRVQMLLENTRSIKVKRLFLFFAHRHGHRWLNHLQEEKINLGTGKRKLVQNGVLDPNYLITVPEYI